MPKIETSIDLGKILTIAVTLIGEYRKGRDAVKAAGDPTDPNTGALLSDADLIGLFKMDSQAAVAHIDSLLAKYQQG